VRAYAKNTTYIGEIPYAREMRGVTFKRFEQNYI
jgi:hypothetical protein